MRHLTLLGLFHRAADGRWSLTDLGELLRDDHPLQMWRALSQADQYLGKVDESIYALLGAVRTGWPVWNTIHGRSFWDEPSFDPEFGKGFHQLIGHRSAQIGHVIARSYDWTSVTQVIDVGGGTRRYLRTSLALIHISTGRWSTCHTMSRQLPPSWPRTTSATGV